MECQACRSSKLVLVIMVVVVVLLSYKAFWAPMVAAPVTQLVDATDDDATAKPALDTKEVNLLIQDYIINHPEDIIRSLEVIQKRKLQAMQEEADKVISQNLDAIENANGAPILGNTEGKINIVYFYDYNCNYCIKASQIFDQIVQDNPQVKLTYKPLPYLGEGSEYIARIILAVNKTAPTKFKILHDTLLSSQINSAQEIVELLNKAELDGAEIVKLANSAEVKNILNDNLQLAKNININGVPVYVINGKYYAGVIRAGQIQEIINTIDSNAEVTEVADKKAPKAQA